MTNSEIARRRLCNQLVAGGRCERAEDVVRHLGAVQAQDYAGAKWAVAQRTVAATDAALDQAFAAGTILRTHVLRPTWHFVLPADIRWLLALTAPRVHALMAASNRNLELDEAALARSDAALTAALQGGRQRTRAELTSAVRQAGIAVGDGQRLGHMLMRAELNAIICSGALRGKQHTYALLDERAPQKTSLRRDEALATLTQRYFTSRGPATLKDFVWWSGLTLTDARMGVEMVTSQLAQEVIDGQAYWFPPSAVPAENTGAEAHLLPNFDEYVVGYTDRHAIFDAAHTEKLDSRGNPLFQNTVVIDGAIIGTWKRTLKGNSVVFQATPFTPLPETEARAVSVAAARYGSFLAMPVNLARSQSRA